MKVIFLDFDGVIVIPPDWRKANPACIHRLNKITEITGAKLVVSSTWRLTERWEQCLKDWGVTGEVIGCTPSRFVSENGSHIRSRSMEIRAWLDEHPEIEDFIVIDDEITDFNKHHKQVGTDFRWGLTGPEMNRAINLLGEENVKQ